MKKYITLLIVLFASSVSALDFEKNLKNNNSNGYFPEKAEYVVFPKLCNNQSCFYLVSVSHVLPNRHGIRRFDDSSDAEKYTRAQPGANPV